MQQLTKLPNDLYVGQSMWFYYSNQISELPTKLYVGVFVGKYGYKFIPLLLLCIKNVFKS